MKKEEPSFPGNKKRFCSFEIMDENYKYYKEHEICPQCGVREHAPGRVRCEICLAQNAESSRRHRDKESKEQRNERLAAVKIHHRKMRSKRKDSGKCIWCGKPLSAYSTCFCPDCRIKNQKNNERRKSGIPRSERHLYGICYKCGKNPVIPGRKLCEICYEQSLNALKSAEKSEKTAERRNYIRQQNNLIFGR